LNENDSVKNVFPLTSALSIQTIPTKVSIVIIGHIKIIKS
jgi:hypothetical protein